jgi:hypothetical protein
VIREQWRISAEPGPCGCNARCLRLGFSRNLWTVPVRWACPIDGICTRGRSARAARIAAAGAVILLAAVSTSRTVVQALRDPPVRLLPGGATGLRAPSVIAAAGTRIWLASGTGAGGGSVTELDAASGRRVWTVSGARYGLDDPSAIAADGTRVWVAQ